MALACSECSNPIDLGERVVCARCEEAGEMAAQDAAAEVMRGEAPSGLERLTDWVMSQKMRGNLSAREVELFNQAIEDVEIGSW